MAIGERIRFIRNPRGMTQKYLVMLVGFSEKAACIHMVRYEYGDYHYRFSEGNTAQPPVKVPSKELSDALVELSKTNLKTKAFRI